MPPKSAFETCDDIANETMSIYKVTEEGIPIGKINVDLLEKDYGLFWEYHERELYIIMAVCSIVFFIVLLGAK